MEEFVISTYGLPGRPAADRTAIARAFVAKMIYNMPTTRILLDRLQSDRPLRRICGWEQKSDVAEEWTFSRAFAEFAKQRLPERVHEVLISKSYDSEIVGHISRDSTAIEAREKSIKKVAKDRKASNKRGRPRKGEVRVKEPTRLEKQIGGEMTLSQMLDDLPKDCDGQGQKRTARVTRAVGSVTNYTLMQLMAAYPLVAFLPLHPVMIAKVPYPLGR